ncbi:MAG: VOC family protein [Candidatus Kapabacteria bacterium]|nr:VOC family protein [Candidatus Kapabacteria bacterium]
MTNLRLTIACMIAVASMPALSQSPASKVDLFSAVRIELTSRDLLESLTWWARLGFSPIRRPGDRVDSALTLTDGQVVITLVRKSQPSPALIFSVEDLEATKRALDGLGFRSDAATQDSTLREIRLRSPNSVFATIRPKKVETEIRPTTEMNPVCGKLTELSTAAEVLSTERDWWSKLGFKVVRGDSIPYKYVNMTSGFTEIGIHQGRDVPSLTLTYFMPDMVQRINRLSNQGLEPAEVVPGIDNQVRNAVYVSPDGQVVYLFEGKR